MADKRAYFKTDCGYFENPKVGPLVDSHPRSIFIHQRAIAYCAQHLTDGVFPVGMVARLVCGSYCGSQCQPHTVPFCETCCDVCVLVHAGLILHNGGHSAEVHDYLEHQRSAEQAKGAKAAGRKGAAGRHANSYPQDDCEPQTEPQTEPLADGTPSGSADRQAIEREREREKLLSSEVADAPSRPDVIELLNLLDARLAGNGNKTPSRTKANVNAARLLLDRDGWTLDQAKWLINWCQDDDFWSTNILSMVKFRKNFDQMKAKAKGNRQQANVPKLRSVTQAEAQAYEEPEQAIARRKAERAAEDAAK